MKIAFSGSGIAPFFPISPPPAGFQLPLRVFLFFFRLPLLLAICLIYFLVLQWLPIGSLGKKASLWCILGVPCLWWVDLQVDGVRRGYVILPPLMIASKRYQKGKCERSKFLV